MQSLCSVRIVHYGITDKSKPGVSPTGSIEFVSTCACVLVFPACIWTKGYVMRLAGQECPPYRESSAVLQFVGQASPPAKH